jgi:molybdopterin-guanine dinucleotide biosynthesis protein A
MFTVIIPAAGMGTRMGQDIPKALTPFLGSTFLGWQLQKLRFLPSKILVVVSPDHVDAFVRYRDLHDLEFEIVTQEIGKGSFYAVRAAIPFVTTPFILVCWVDQVGLSESLIIRTSSAIQVKGIDAVIPLVYKEYPYVKIHRSPEGKLSHWEYQREGATPSAGFSDLGLFALRTSNLLEAMQSIKNEAGMISPLTKEFNFLEFLCKFGEFNEIKFLVTQDDLNSVAVNTTAELRRAETRISKNRLQKTFSIIIPSYNEEPRLPNLLLEIQKLCEQAVDQKDFDLEIIFVDDGSSDNTRNLLSKTPFSYLYQENSGKGSAVKKGVSHSSGDYIIVLDADGEYSVAEIPLLIACVLQNPTSVVYGSRYLKDSFTKVRLRPLPGQSILNLYFNHLLSLLIGIRFRKVITDSLTGFKLYPREIYLAVNPETTGFETDHELSKAIVRWGIPIIEIPVSYLPRSRAEGKKISAADALKALGIWLK